jgi:hypothetical protein
MEGGTGGRANSISDSNLTESELEPEKPNLEPDKITPEPGLDSQKALYTTSTTSSIRINC